MAVFSVPDVAIAGISACVPAHIESNHDYEHLSSSEQKLLIKTTGIEERRLSINDETTADLCFRAAEALISELDWDRSEIRALIFVSQSPDYFLPASAIILQDRLGLPKSTIAFDLSLGCSGYVNGLAVLSSLMSHSRIEKALLLVGDVSSSSVSREDTSTYPLFGDAGSATALRFETGQQFDFNLQSDGSGFRAIIIEGGGLRNPPNPSTDSAELVKYRKLALDGPEIFNFAMREVEPSLQALCKFNRTSISDYDYLVLHQANQLINESIRRKLDLEPAKVPSSLPAFGNTSSASIPLTLVTELAADVRESKMHLLLSGFGVGLSWGSAAVAIDHLCCPELIEV